MIILKIKLLICYLLYFPHLVAFRKSREKYRIEQDIERWCEEVNFYRGGEKTKDVNISFVSQASVS